MRLGVDTFELKEQLDNGGINSRILERVVAFLVEGEVEVCVRIQTVLLFIGWRVLKKKLLNGLAARATLHTLYAAMPASLVSPPPALRLVPSCSTLGPPNPYEHNILIKNKTITWPSFDGTRLVYRFSMAFLSPSSCAIGLPAVECWMEGPECGVACGSSVCVLWVRAGVWRL